jgi:hypothetical protein
MKLARLDNLNNLPTATWYFNDRVNRLIAGDNQVRPWSPAVDIHETDKELISGLTRPV